MKLSPISAIKLSRILEKNGFKCIRQKGSHRFYRHIDGRTTVIPMHSGTKIGKGLLKAILKETQLARKDLEKK